MKSYYSITLLIAFALVMSVMAVVSAAMRHIDISASEGAIVALAICSAILAFRLSQAEKRIAHLEDRIENLLQHKAEEHARAVSSGKKADTSGESGTNRHA